MPSLTIKGLPEELHEALRELAESERRSLTQQAIRLLEESVARRREDAERQDEVTRQADAWRSLSGRWVSDKSVDEEIDDIYETRTEGRDVEL